MTAVQLSKLQQCYGKSTVLHDLNLSLEEGEVLGLFGHNGAGKTTTMKLILGLLKPTAGTVSVLGQHPDHPLVRSQLGYLPENVMFYPQLTGRETLEHFARLKRAGTSQVTSLLEDVGLGHAAAQRVKTYSKGMRQRLGLAQALLGSPRLLLLDEPTVGLDPIATQALYELVDRLRQQGCSIILCSHVLPGVEPHIDRAAVLAYGRLQAVGSLSQLRQAAHLPTRIRVMGMPDQAQWLKRWKDEGIVARGFGANNVEITTQADSKISLLREVLAEAELHDLEIQQATLEDLYLHHMQQADSQRKAEATT